MVYSSWVNSVSLVVSHSVVKGISLPLLYGVFCSELPLVHRVCWSYLLEFKSSLWSGFLRNAVVGDSSIACPIQVPCLLRPYPDLLSRMVVYRVPIAVVRLSAFGLHSPGSQAFDEFSYDELRFFVFYCHSSYNLGHSSRSSLVLNLPQLIPLFALAFKHG